MILHPPAKSTEQTVCQSQWWQTPSPTYDDIDWTPYFATRDRRDLVDAIAWAIGVSRDDLDRRYYSGHRLGLSRATRLGLSRATRLGLHLAHWAAIAPPLNQTQAGWLSECIAWRDGYGSLSTSECPPTAWEHETGMMFGIFRTLSRCECRVTMSRRNFADCEAVA